MSLWRANLGQRGTSFAVLTVFTLSTTFPLLTATTHAQAPTPSANTATECTQLSTNLTQSQNTINARIKTLNDSRVDYDANSGRTTGSAATLIQQAEQAFRALTTYQEALRSYATKSCGSQSAFDSHKAKLLSASQLYNQAVEALKKRAPGTFSAIQIFTPEGISYTQVGGNTALGECKNALSQISTKLDLAQQTIADASKLNDEIRAGLTANDKAITPEEQEAMGQRIEQARTAWKQAADAYKGATNCNTGATANEYKTLRDRLKDLQEKLNAIETVNGENATSVAGIYGSTVANVQDQYALYLKQCGEKEGSWWNLAGKFIEVACAMGLAVFEGVGKLLGQLATEVEKAYREW